MNHPINSQTDSAKRSRTSLTALRIIRVALCGCLLWVGQIALSALPNVELVTFLIAQFTLIWPKDTKYACLVYVALCGLQWGVGIWLASYIAAWLSWWLFVAVLQKHTRRLSNTVLAISSGAFGLCFGIFFAVPYVFADPCYAFSFWASGLVWDLVHAIFNCVIMLTLGKPVHRRLVLVHR